MVRYPENFDSIARIYQSAVVTAVAQPPFGARSAVLFSVKILMTVSCSSLLIRLLASEVRAYISAWSTVAQYPKEVDLQNDPVSFL